MKKTNVKQTFGKKVTSMILAAVLAVGCLTGCGGSTTTPGTNKDKDAEIDENKTLLVVATYDAGVRSEWISKAAERFEKKFADTSFEEGKKGVQVSVISSQNYTGGALLDSLQSESADVWFTEGVNYIEHINKGNFADITDIVTEKLTEYGEEKSIADKIDSQYRDFLNQGTEDNPTYYAVPFYDAFYGLTYDKDVFLQYKLYFKTSGTEAGDAEDSLAFISSEADKKSAGRDGKYDTYDDGLPATYAQFMLMINEMKKNDIIPFVYPGATGMYYPLRTLGTFLAQAEGAERYAMNFKFEGTADDLVKLDANGKVVKDANGQPKLESLAITQDNGYELQRQLGRYRVLELFNTILEDEGNLCAPTFIHTSAQANFLKGKADEHQTYGMLIDGSWWPYEAVDSFEALSDRYGDEYKLENRNIAFMPLPVPSKEDVGRENVLLNTNKCLGFIRSNTKLMDCAKAFLQFTTTDAEMSEFTVCTSFCRGLNYELTPECAEKVSPFGRSMHEMKTASTVIYPYSDAARYVNNEAFFNIETWSFSTAVDSGTYDNPWQFWLNYKGKYSVDDYFKGMYEYNKTRWSTLN